ncbi:hypothetical protein HID58_089057, partial [Brassica napus]
NGDKIDELIVSSSYYSSSSVLIKTSSSESTSFILGMKGLKIKRPSTGGGVSSRTRGSKAVSNGNEPVREESNPVRGTTVVSLSFDTESEGMSAVSSKVINSVLVPTMDEETLLARITDPESKYHREGSTSDRWNYWLNVKQKKIWWKELYESDVAARKFTKTEDKEKVTIVEGSSSNSGLESMLKGVEERIVKAMEEGFSGINLTVETKLEAMNWTMGKLEKNQRVLKKKAKKIEDRLTSIESKENEDEEYRQWNDFDYDRDHGKDREMAEAEKDKEKAETWKKNSEKSEEDEENSGKDEEDEENSEKGEEEEEQEPEKDKENSDSVEKGEENMEESDEEDSLLRLQERVRVQAEEFWRTIDDESDAEKEAEKEAEEEGEKEGEKDGEKEAEKEVQEEKEAEKDGEKEAEKEAEKEVKEEKEAEEEESKGTRTTTGVIIITPRGRTKAAAERKAIQTEIAELAEKEAEVEAIQTEQEAIQTVIVEKKAEVTEKDAEVAEKEEQDVDEEEEKAEESDKNPDVDQDVEEEEEKAEESEDNPVESPSEKQTELAEKSVEVEVKTKRKPRVKLKKKKAKADGTPKKKGRPKKTDVTLKTCTLLPEKRKGEPSRWVQSPFTEEKTDELEVPKKKLKTKT